MKTSFFLVVFSIIFFNLLNSCSRDYDGGFSKRANEEHEVILKVYSNSEGVPVTVQTGLVIKDYWESKFVTKESFAQIIARCDDPTALLRAEIYVDGKLRVKDEKNRYLNISCYLKND